MVRHDMISCIRRRRVVSWSESDGMAIVSTSHVGSPTLCCLMFISSCWRTLPRSTISSRLFYENARFFQKHTLHSTSVSRLRASQFPKLHATNRFSATHRDAMRHRPRSHLQPDGPFHRFRRRFDNIPPNYLIIGILGINGAIFATWSYIQIFPVR